MTLLAAASFLPRARPPVLADDAIHLWLYEAAPGAPARDVAAGAKGLLSTLLRSYAGMAEAPAVATGARGKPYLPSHPRLQFNLSHAGRHALLAFARDQPLGVDIERLDRRIAIEDVAARFFHPREAAALARVAPARKAEAFLALWTHKEAVLKALGAGLSFGLDRIRFDWSPGGGVRLAECVAEAGTCGDWRLNALAPAAGLTGALAWHGQARDVQAFRHAADAAARRSGTPARPC